MIAKENTKYALIINNAIAEIFDSSKYPSWNEESITAIELTKEQEEWAFIGLVLSNTGELVRPSLDELKSRTKEYLTQCFQDETDALKGRLISQAEQASWGLQVSEAKAYQTSQNPADAPFISVLASARGQELGEYATKIIEKNTTYNQNLALLLGNYQALCDKVDSASDYDGLSEVVYVSPFAESNNNAQG